MLSRLRAMLMLGSIAFALPATCSHSGDGTYAGGIEPSPAGRINPAEPGFSNGR